MIDLHSHILHEVDDGSESLKQSLRMAEMAYKTGYRKICCTTHFKTGQYENEEYDKKFKELESALKDSQIDIKIVKGNELFLSPECLNALEDRRVNTLGGNSNYLLVEAVPGMTSSSLENALKAVKSKGYSPVLAHVERYPQLSLEEARKMTEDGIVLQMNLGSLKNSLRSKSMELLKEGLIDIVSSDAHREETRSYDLLGTLEILERAVGKEGVYLLAQRNPERILKNLKLDGGSYERKKINNPNFFSFIFNKFFRRDRS